VFSGCCHLDVVIGMTGKAVTAADNGMSADNVSSNEIGTKNMHYAFH